MKEINENEIEKAVGGTGQTAGEESFHEPNDPVCDIFTYSNVQPILDIQRAVGVIPPRMCGMCMYLVKSSSGEKWVCKLGK